MARIFIAGIIQGSIADRAIHAQDYRAELKRLLAAHAPGEECYCPIENHPDSLGYDEETGRGVFLNHVRMAREYDALVAFVPQASMGTAVEMWEAHNAGRLVLTISPMTENWAIKFLSDRVFPDMAAFGAFLAAGGLKEALARKRAQRKP